MPEPEHFDVVWCDHVDGVRLGPMPFHDPKALNDLLKKRMTPEVYDEFVDTFIAIARYRNA